jgi:hypothetical protein
VQALADQAARRAQALPELLLWVRLRRPREKWLRPTLMQTMRARTPELELLTLAARAETVPVRAEQAA